MTDILTEKQTVQALGAIEVLFTNGIDFVPIPVINDKDRERMVKHMLKRIKTVSEKGDGKQNINILEAVGILLFNGIDFIPIPVINDNDRERMIKFMMRRMEIISKQAEN